MLPQFTEHGLLPAGIHMASMEEFKERFVYFGVSDRRYRLFDKLQDVCRVAQNAGFLKRFFVGGSFVTSKREPNDFDCILVYDPAIQGRELSPMEYNLLWRPRARRTFGGDIISVADGSVTFDDYVRFFQNSRDNRPVGIVEIIL